MALPKFETDISFISKLDDEPNDVGGLSSTELKERFDKAGNLIQQFLNTVFIPYLEAATGAGDIGIADIPGLNNAANVQAALEELKTQLNNTSTGSIPDGSLGGEKLKAAAVDTLQLADGSVTAAKLAGGVIDDSKIAAEKLSGASLQDKAIDNKHLNGKVVKGTNIEDNSIGAGQIADLAITAGKIAADAVQTPKIKDGAVTGEKIAAGAVSTTYTGVLLASGWTETDGAYTQDVNNIGFAKLGTTAIVDLDMSDGRGVNIQLQRDEEWTPIKADPRVGNGGSVFFRFRDEPTIDLPFKLTMMWK